MQEPVFVRNMQQQYFILLREEKGAVGFEQKMVCKNCIHGLLKVELRSIDNEEQYYYDVTGKKSVAEYFKEKKLASEDIKFIYDGIISGVLNTKKYLLEEDNFVINKNSLFIDENENKLYLCYKEDYHCNIQEQVTKLTEYFMNYIDYEDEKVVLYLYGIYRMIRKETCTFIDIRNVLNKYSSELACDNHSLSLEQTENPKIENLETNTPLEENENVPCEVITKRDTKYSIVAFANSYSIVVAADVIIQILFVKLRWLDNKVTGKLDIQKCLLSGILLFFIGIGAVKFIKKKKYDENELVFANIDTDFGETMILNQSCLQYKLVSQNKEKDILFTSEDCPMLIGKVMEAGKGKLADKTISKRHAELQCSGSNVYIKDLGSVNGSYINMERLKEGVIYPLKDGDKVCLSNLEFIFRVCNV